MINVATLISTTNQINAYHAYKPTIDFIKTELLLSIRGKKQLQEKLVFNI